MSEWYIVMYVGMCVCVFVRACVYVEYVEYVSAYVRMQKKPAGIMLDWERCEEEEGKELGKSRNGHMQGYWQLL